MIMKEDYKRGWNEKGNIALTQCFVMHGNDFPLKSSQPWRLKNPI